MAISTTYTLLTDHLQTHAQHVPSIPGINDTIIQPHSTGTIALAIPLDAVAEGPHAAPEVLLDELPPLGRGAGALDRLHDSRELVGAHDAAASRGPGKEEPGAVRPPAHGVVAGAVRGAHDDREVRDRAAAHGRHHLRAALDYGGVLGFGAHHEACHVVQEYDGDVSGWVLLVIHVLDCLLVRRTAGCTCV